MKQLFALLMLLLACVVAQGQLIGGGADVVTIYSQNERFYLRSIPFDDESPSLRGKTLVYESGSETPLYTLDRGFDIIQPNSLILSDDGQTIFLATTWGADEEKDGMKSSGLNEEERYKLYTVVVSGNLLRDGSLEIEAVEIDPELPKEKILEFFKTNRFDSRPLPAPCGICVTSISTSATQTFVRPNWKNSRNAASRSVNSSGASHSTPSTASTSPQILVNVLSSSIRSCRKSTSRRCAPYQHATK
jgi:hypothetical protein